MPKADFDYASGGHNDQAMPPEFNQDGTLRDMCFSQDVNNNHQNVTIISPENSLNPSLVNYDGSNPPP